VYLGLNRLREAREQFQSVLSLFPVLSRQGLGEVALRERRFEEAIVVGLAILLPQKERLGEAVTLLDDANRQYPDRVATPTTLARLLASSPDRSQREASVHSISPHACTRRLRRRRTAKHSRSRSPSSNGVMKR
jgi:predicted Zn-dependent protease